MVRVFEAQQVGGLVDIMAVHQEVLSLIYHKGMDIADGGAAGSFVDNISQVTGRIGQLSGAVLDGGNAEFQLFAVQIIFPQQIVEALEKVR